MRKLFSGRQAHGTIGFKGKTTVADAAAAGAAAGGDSVVAEPRSKRRAAKKEFAPDQKLLGLRKLFDSVTPGQNLDAYIVPSEDAHQSEFIADCYMRRGYISAFTGSAGTAVVTKDKAALWTDGRYFLQVCFLCSSFAFKCISSCV
jgi:hypothetical protein